VVATNWFSARRGLALGATLAGASANAIVMPLIVNHMILANGYRNAYRLSAVTVLLGVVPLVLLVVRTRPPEISDSPSVTEVVPVAGLELGPAVRGAAFWLLVVLNLGAGTAVGGYYYHSVPFLIGAGYSQTTCAMLVSIGAIIGVGGFFAIGMLADRFGPRPTLCGAMLGLGTAIAIAPLLRYWPLAIPVFAIFMNLQRHYGAILRHPSRRSLTLKGTRWGTSIAPVLLLRGTGSFK
jgi:nitrate/nitrite transporter NarK